MLDVYEVKIVNPFGGLDVEIIEGKEELRTLRAQCQVYGGEIQKVTKLKVLDHK